MGKDAKAPCSLAPFALPAHRGSCGGGWCRRSGPEVGLDNDVAILGGSGSSGGRLAGSPTACQHCREPGRVQPHPLVVAAWGLHRHQQPQLCHVHRNCRLRAAQVVQAHGAPRLESQPEQEVDGNSEEPTAATTAIISARATYAAVAAIAVAAIAVAARPCRRPQARQVLPHHAPQLAIHVGQQELEAMLADGCTHGQVDG